MIRMTFAATAICGATAATATEFNYVLTGGTSIIAYENAARSMVIDTSGEMHIDAAGAISGTGTMTFIWMRPCEWAPPVPVDDVNCRIDGVRDGAFSISGSVLETVHRHDDDNPLKDAIFAFADEKAVGERPGYAPYRISLTLTPTALPEENLTFWGFSNGGTASRTTGAATLGMLVAGLFDQPFELIALNSEAGVSVPGDGHKHSFTGLYDRGTVVRGIGTVMLSSIDRQWLPSKTDPWVYLQHWADGPAEREWSQAEQDAMATYEETGVQEDTRAGIGLEIEDMISDVTGEEIEHDIDETVEQIVDILDRLPGLKLD